MRNRLIAAAAVIAAVALLAATPVGAEAAKLITGKDIKNNSVTGKDIKNNSLTGKDVKGSSLTGGDVKNGTLGSADVTDGSLTGVDVKDGTLTGADIDESTLGTVPVAGSLEPLGSGETQSGIFSMASAASAGDSGYLGDAINYVRPLETAIAETNIIDTDVSPDPTNCPGPGQAAPGYLCLYFDYHEGIGEMYGYSDSPPYSEVTPSVGVALYAPITSTGDLYADGVWTVTAP